MSKGLKIEFKKNKCRILPQESVEGIDCEVQNSLVNVATQKESSKYFPDQGTTILKELAQNGFLGQKKLEHLSNFAAVDTLFFVRNNMTTTGTEEFITKIALVPKEVTANGVYLEMAIQTNLDTKIGNRLLL